MNCTCGHPNDYNYAIDNGDCNSCIAEKLEQLTDENKRLREECSDKTERLGTIKELAEMYESLLGTNQEAPWVRTMMSIYGQAEQALKESDHAV